MNKCILLAFLLVILPGCIYLPSSPESSGGGQVPVISSFYAKPDTITAGEKTQLSWEVIGATHVSIDNGVGAVALNGARTVMPDISTTYILTAANQYGSTSASVKVHVDGSSATPSGLPVINSFTASPSTIGAGESSTLIWNVSNAAQVTISGIGSVDSVGSQSVSPASTTSYTLTATSAGGSWVSKTINVSVGVLGPPPVGKPDLIVQSISKIETPTGYIIGFNVKNNGPSAAGASICRLLVEGIQKSDVNIPALSAGADYDGSFPAWIYSPITPHIKVVADATGTVAEADEINNEKSVTMAVAIIYDFVNEASSPSTDVKWSSGAGTLTFGGAIDDPKGFACYRTNVTLEDNNVYDRVLETHPQWVDNGYITGTYMELYNTLGYQVKAGDHFYTKCGFIKNAMAGKVKFRVMIRDGSSNIWIAENVKFYDGTIKEIAVDLTPYTGKKVDFILQVSAEGSSGQDWAVWYQARIIR